MQHTAKTSTMEDETNENETKIEQPSVTGGTKTHEIPFGFKRAAAELKDFFAGYRMT
jgi:hypothetical protein